MLLITGDAQALDHRCADRAQLIHDDRVPLLPARRKPGPRRSLSVSDLIGARHRPPLSMHPPNTKVLLAGAHNVPSEDDDTFNDQMARACRLAVAGPEYRLVPDVTIAEQIDQCVAVAEWLAANAAAEFGTGTLLIGGISAGAHLAAAALLRLRDGGSPAFAQIAAARLDSGTYDLGGTASNYLPT